jgi:hypothetical protein
MERYTQRNFRNYFIADGGWDRALIKFPLDQRTIEVDYSSQGYEIRPVVPGGSPVWDSTDTDCSKLATKFLLSDLRLVGEATIAGIRSIEYTGLRPKSERWNVWLTPSLGCTQMKVIRYAHNRFGLPTSYSRSEVVAVQVGEPDTKLFQARIGLSTGSVIVSFWAQRALVD